MKTRRRILTALLLALLLGAGALWAWAGSETSLAAALAETMLSTMSIGPMAVPVTKMPGRPVTSSRTRADRSRIIGILASPGFSAPG